MQALLPMTSKVSRVFARASIGLMFFFPNGDLLQASVDKTTKAAAPADSAVFSMEPDFTTIKGFQAPWLDARYNTQQLVTELPASPRNTELLYIDTLGFLDGMTCENWPKQAQNYPEELLEEVDAFARLGHDSDRPDPQLQALADVLKWMGEHGVSNPIQIGSKHSLTLALADFQPGEPQELVALDLNTEVGFALSGGLLCSPRDISRHLCEIRDCRTEREAGQCELVLADGRSQHARVLRRRPDHERPSSEFHSPRGRPSVLLAAPLIWMADTNLIAHDINLVVVANEIHRTAKVSDDAVLGVVVSLPEEPLSYLWPRDWSWNPRWNPSEKLADPPPGPLISVVARRITGLREVRADRQNLTLVVGSLRDLEEACAEESSVPEGVDCKDRLGANEILLDPWDISPGGTGIISQDGGQSCYRFPGGSVDNPYELCENYVEYRLLLPAVPVRRDSGVVIACTTNCSGIARGTAPWPRVRVLGNSTSFFAQAMASSFADLVGGVESAGVSVEDETLGTTDYLYWRTSDSDQVREEILVQLLPALERWLDRLIRPGGPLSLTFEDQRGVAAFQHILSNGELLRQSFQSAESKSLRTGRILGWRGPWEIVSGLPGYCSGSEESCPWRAAFERAIGAPWALGWDLQRIEQRWRYEHNTQTRGEPEVGINAIDRQFGALARGFYQERDSLRSGHSRPPPTFSTYKNRWEDSIRLFEAVRERIEGIQGSVDIGTAIETLVQLGMENAEDLRAAAEGNLVTRDAATQTVEQILVELRSLEGKLNVALADLADLLQDCGDRRIAEIVQKVGEGAKGVATGVDLLNLLLENAYVQAVAEGLRKAGETLVGAKTPLQHLLKESEPCQSIDKKILRRQIGTTVSLIELTASQLSLAEAVVLAWRADREYYETTASSLEKLRDRLVDLDQTFSGFSKPTWNSLRELGPLCVLGREALAAARDDLFDLQQIVHTTRGRPWSPPYFEVPGGTGCVGLQKEAKRYGFAWSLWDPDPRAWHPPGDAAPSTSPATEFLETVDCLSEQLFSNQRWTNAPFFVVRKRLRRTGCVGESTFGSDPQRCPSPDADSICAGADALLTNGVASFQVTGEDLINAVRSKLDDKLPAELFEATAPIVLDAVYQIYDSGCEGDPASGGCESCATRFATEGLSRGVPGSELLYLVNAASEVATLVQCNAKQPDWRSWPVAEDDPDGSRVATCLRPVQTRPQVERLEFVDASQRDRDRRRTYRRSTTLDSMNLAKSSIHGLPVLGTWHLVFDPARAKGLADGSFGQGSAPWIASQCAPDAEAPYTLGGPAFPPNELDRIKEIHVVFLVAWLPSEQPAFALLP